MATRKPTRKKKRPSAQVGKKADPDRSRRVWGVILIIFSIYAAYAFSTATPGMVEKIIGKGIVTFLFGNVTFMMAIYGIASGLMLFTDKYRYYTQTMGLVFLMLCNFLVGFSLNIPKLLTYTIADLFSLAAIGGYGGIFGTIFAYLFETILGQAGTTVLLVLLFIIEGFLIYKANFNESYQKLKSGNFGMNAVKGKMDGIKEAKDLRDKRKEAEERREEEAQQLADQNYDDLFHRSDTGQISVDTQYLDIGDVLDAMDPEEAAKAKLERQARKAEARQPGGSPKRRRPQTMNCRSRIRQS